MAKGRKPTPTALKKLRGNPSKRKLKKEPVSRVGVGSPPNFVSDEAREVWLSLRPKLETMRVLTEADEIAFTALCEAIGEWRVYRRMLNEGGGRIKEHPTKKGAYLYNPVGFVDKIEKRMHDWLVEFGLTPSARSKVSAVEKDEPKKAELLAFDGGKK
jgi:P27 family predicted phage terminase small subunit